MRALRKLDGQTPYSPFELVAKLKGTDAVIRFESGQISSNSFYDEIRGLLKLNLSFDEFTAIWSDIFVEELILDESFFEPLKSHYRLILLSNTNAMHAAFLMDRFPILRIFDEQVFSFEVGAIKPSEMIYQAAREAAHTMPERLFYVDDIPAYIEAAAKLGWNAVQFSGKDRLIHDMRTAGIELG